MAQVSAEIPPPLPASPATPDQGDGAAPAPGLQLPRVVTALSPSGAVAALATASRRGRVPGFEDRGGGAFQTAAFGSPFDGVLDCRAAAVSDHTAITCKPRLKPLMPATFAVVLLASIWPGVELTESLVASFFPGSAAWQYTWWWYLPLTVTTCPWAFWEAFKRSRAAVHASAHEVIQRIAKEVGGRVEPIR